MAYDIHYKEYAETSLTLFNSKFINFEGIDFAMRWGLSRKPWKCEKNHGTDIRCMKLGPAFTDDFSPFVITVFFTLIDDKTVEVAYFETREWTDPLDSTGAKDEIWKNLLIAQE